MLGVFAAAVLGRLPALQSWWCLDDWGQLARAAGLLAAEPGLPARWLSQQFWWQMTWPVLQLDATAHGLLRLLLHGLAAVTVVRVAFRVGLGSLAGLLAGLLFAASPVAFTILFWASGIQELLAGLLALVAVERWLAGNRRDVLLALLCGAGSILAKESGFFLPLLFLGLLWYDRRRSAGGSAVAWAVAAGLLLLVVLESILVLNHFGTEPGDPYHVAGPRMIPSNLGTFGWWLGTPGAVFTGQMTWTAAGIGSLLFVVWGICGWWAWRHGRRAPLVLLLAALGSLGPALMLHTHISPYLAYVAAAGLYLSLVHLIPGRWRLGVPLGGVLVVAAMLWGLLGMRASIARVDADGLPVTPVIRAAVVSRESADRIQESVASLAAGKPVHLVVFQQPLREADLERAARLGPEAVKETPRRTALGGELGLALLAGPGGSGRWVNSLLDVRPEATVFCETAERLEPWGPCWDALIYATFIDVVVGNYERAFAQLQRALDIDDDPAGFKYDADRCEVPAPSLRAGGSSFVRWMNAERNRGSLSAAEIATLQRQFSILVRQVLTAESVPASR